MIHRLHHIEFDWPGDPAETADAAGAPPVPAAWADLGRFLGLGPAAAPRLPGAVRPVIALDNVRLIARQALQPGGSSPVTPRPPRPLSALAFEVEDFDRALHRFRQRALGPREGDAARLAGLTGEALRVADLDPAAGFGVPLRIVGPAGDGAGPPPAPVLTPTDPLPAGRVTGIDHVVVRTADPERAVATYAGRLGLSLRLDRSEPAWGVRLLFFRCGDMIVEVAHPLARGEDAVGSEGAPTDRIETAAGPRDELWGITWRTDDIDAARARLEAEGIGVSAIRTGRRPGTRVFTVRSHTGGVPTLLIGA